MRYTHDVAPPHEPDRSPTAIFALRLMRTVPSLSSQALRVSFLRTTLQATSPRAAATALDHVCAKANQGDPTAREVLVSFAGLMQEPDAAPLVDALRACLENEPLDALARFIRKPLSLIDDAGVAQPVDENEQRVPDYGRGRTLTLGERKSLARRPTRQMLDRLLADPHPQVIRNVLNNSITTEDDILRLAARRPLRPEIIQEIARHPRWNVRRRVRLALVLNPACPPELAVPMVGLLLKSELRTVLQLTELHPDVRNAAREHLRRPVTLPGDDGTRRGDLN